MANIVCWRSGEVEVVSRRPEGTILVLGGLPKQRLEAALSAVARHAYDGTTLLVPGLPEADDEKQAVTAVSKFRDALRGRLESHVRGT